LETAIGMTFRVRAGGRVLRNGRSRRVFGRKLKKLKQKKP